MAWAEETTGALKWFWIKLPVSFRGSASAAATQIAIMHEVHPVDVGCGIRVTRLEFDPQDADGLLDTVRSTTIPAAELLPHFQTFLKPFI